MRRDVPDLQLTAPGETREKEGGGWMKKTTTLHDGDQGGDKTVNATKGKKLQVENTKISFCFFWSST